MRFLYGIVLLCGFYSPWTSEADYCRLELVDKYGALSFDLFFMKIVTTAND